MQDRLVLGFAQLNPVVGDISGNLSKLRDVLVKAAKQGVHLVMTSELYLCGYPAEDLVLKPCFQDSVRVAVEALALETAGGCSLLLGTPWKEEGKLYNAMLLLSEGRIAATIFKHDLPTYGVFDEKRVFAAGGLPEPVAFRGVKLGVMICEDMWTPAVAGALKRGGAQILLVANASPFEVGKWEQRQDLARRRVQETGLALVYLNQVGGQDELVFDGGSFVVEGAVVCSALWREDFFVAEWFCSNNLPMKQEPNGSLPFEGRAGAGGVKLGKQVPESETSHPAPSPPPCPSPQGGGNGNGTHGLEIKPVGYESAIYNALLLGLRDYVTKNNFSGVVLGLSGGMDSALVATLAVDALGADRVWVVRMSSPYTSVASVEDAGDLARILKCRLDDVPLTASMEAFEKSLAGLFAGRGADLTEENIQARCRGVILMALSNKFGSMVLATGNKSEMAVGYSTLYGDLCGGFAVLKDLYKTEVYKVARWRNAHRPAGALGPEGVVIPEAIFTKAPTAELRPNQTDQDSLPPYDVLDGILEGLIEKNLGVRDLVALGFDEAVVKRVAVMLDRAEYKRRQAPPGVKITRRLLGKDRRYPITNRYSVV